MCYLYKFDHTCLYIYIQMHTSRFDSYRNVPNGKMTLSLLMAIQCRKIIMRNQLPFTFHVQISSNIFSTNIHQQSRISPKKNLKIPQKIFQFPQKLPFFAASFTGSTCARSRSKASALPSSWMIFS